MERYFIGDWVVDLAASTATRKDGWVFKFSRALDDNSAFDLECISHPENLTMHQVLRFARISRESGDVYLIALLEKIVG